MICSFCIFRIPRGMKVHNVFSRVDLITFFDNWCFLYVLLTHLQTRGDTVLRLLS